MRPLSLYLDSSVIGGYFDAEFEEATRKLWQEMEAGTYRFVTSPLVSQEISGAPENVRALLAATFIQSDLLPLTEEIEQLTAAYMAQKIVPTRYEDDARHVAVATVHHIGLVVSWNFKHLVNYQRETGLMPSIYCRATLPSVSSAHWNSFMKTTIKKEFNAVAESRKWREKTSVLLSTMTSSERIAFINRRIGDLPKTRPAQPPAASSS